MSYRSTIARQPQQLASSLAAIEAELEKLDLAPLREGVLGITGIGASYEAAVVTAGELQRRGRRATAWHAVDLMEPGNPVDAIVALSSGGRSVEPVTALRKHAGAFSIAVTSEGDNPLAEAARSSICFQSGADATPSSTGYTGTLLATGMLSDALCGKSTDWMQLTKLAGQVLAESAAKMERAGAIFRQRRAIDCVGAVSALGTAGEAGLLIREAARIPAGATDTLHYLHGPMEPMDSTTGVLIFGDGRELKLAQDMAEIGCAVLLVTTNTEIADKDNLTVVRVPAFENRIARALLDILPAQLLAAELSDAAGLTDTKFRYRQTDTKINKA
ncbi:glucosamine--fructose-6-phosphate aminotransferase [Sinorhizobium meliloti]|uniref:SIS domain-containing protein n=1 Tax=Rhizobium meliloti TaxID=382 RepID=UPI00299D7527|nr:glucosamine--fructose-6-phosphate aminotransferase [Sinorhizobium meliloti]MDW9923449.1 glucosamine--fructose-6-phosphate aminotransferase [Sinorhizobium meliloti]MDX0018703.1 glucosamine--fructose-6-phosphate aminotransferase [Sinorhizobium meliloti]MDX0035237.1 glucosamine--fructose-6-phosphate aminotransferase [Sinorhizobium meliloti]MDX0124283.1 glucosamine--fructose-6-phosphate aminotransferase [Sinorhizobium meliloti]